MTTRRFSGKGNLTVPIESGADLAYSVVKASISAVPVLGGPSAEFMQLFFAPPIEKRRDEWMKRMAAAVTTLVARGLTVESLQNNEEFISAMQQAAQIAQRTHQAEKLDALRNALLNIAIQPAPDEALHFVYLKYVDAFTEWHLKLLRFFQSTPDARSDFNADEVLLQVHPALKGRPELVNAVIGDLTAMGLIAMGHMGGSSRIVGPMLAPKHTTPLGDRFIKFIEYPVDGSV